jgi:hypothetical protein
VYLGGGAVETEIWTQGFLSSYEIGHIQGGMAADGFLSSMQALYHLSHASSTFCCGYFGDGVLCTLSPGWVRTTILILALNTISQQLGFWVWATGTRLVYYFY